ncbi:DUF2239 family protein [Brevundimonas sp. Sa3CVA3]|uniref:DUF2239 family protein n=2 Tax=Brevundimonas guildfordensis TaxID=2762241 RepID=A0ABR8QWL0_9CAUL|nr:DUF2239 family protein [Brevundimonas guildfordensis]MBD7939893.1 DUF2239 family protein [Brevundimonas guildfordensis]
MMTLCTAFDGHTMIAAGPLAQVAAAMKAAHDAGRAVLVFRDEDARPIDLDLRGDLPTVLARLPQEQPQPEPEKRGPGRPRLGVTAREVTLLPRHWDWLASQPGGASVALRKLVEAALREAEGPDRMRRSREAAYRFMTAVAGDLPDYEEAVRMLFAGDWTAFDAHTEAWPVDVRDYARRLAEPGWRNGHGR